MLIVEGVRILVFGMAGIFVVMGILIAFVLLLNKAGK